MIRFYSLICVIIGCLSLSKTNAQSLSEIINGDNVMLIDVRSEREFNEGTAQNAINIPIEKLANQLSSFQKDKKIVVFCRTGRRSKGAYEFLKSQGFSVYDAQSVQRVKELQKINILKKIEFRTDKQTTYFLKDGKNVKQIAIALGKNAVLKKHTTPVATTLIVLKGKVCFIISNEQIILNEFDVYQISINVEHEVIGINDENIFIVTKGE